MHQEGNYLYADEGKDLLCNFNGINYGESLSLGYVYYDADGNLLDEPHLLTADDFTEIDHVTPEADGLTEPEPAEQGTKKK